MTQKPDRHLPLAKQTIDLLGMLKEKTQGNLTPDEEKLIDHLLADLRWRYIRAKGRSRVVFRRIVSSRKIPLDDFDVLTISLYDYPKGDR
jgi:hypothetical protein